ncbi:MAG: glycosyltransferase family 4 protein [Gammaproteobacteria bacterium]|nr:glycosyltransferase family 4 protein [Gammaproteobacteria bacterium]
MKTILHTIDTNEPGGAETVFIDLATRLPREKYRSLIVIQGKGYIYDELKKRGAKPILLDTRGSFNWRYLKGLISIIRRENVDLIQSHLLGSNVYCSLAGLLTKTPVVAVFHGAVDIDKHERFKWLKFSAINRGAQCIVAVSKNLRDSIIKASPLRKDLTKVIYNGIEIGDFERPHSRLMRQNYGWNDKDIIVGSLGNMHHAKGYDVLLRSAALLKGSGLTFRFVIAGQIKEDIYKDLVKLKTDLSLNETVYFIDFISDPAYFLSNIDYFLLPSLSEGFSIATIQAMAANLAVIVTRSGGPEEIVTHEENGLMVAPGNPVAIAEAVKTLADDSELRIKLACQGNKHVTQTFRIESMLAAYEDIYNSLLH